ncbi:bifunctional aminoglycoside phosphotransferase/ATP-binding protein [Patulibacter defluvii]|uniref:bifunctional aminoglycoside phosphotransferase/ATP-binding protein n=1 Tax=Patulibacter defluvii TaxID=3095358 RepID=UPI002A7553C0|nr:AAA family ATPase [Patulibacter sp. DM4]
MHATATPRCGPTAAALQAIAAAAGVADPGALERRDTHMSVVLLTPDRAYKVKRAHRFAFADHHRRAARLRACREELRVNGELAPGVYRAVHAVVPAGDGFRLAAADDPAAVEYVVEMERFDEATSLRERLARDPGDRGPVAAAAAAIAAFHARARPVRRPGPAAMAVADEKRRLAAEDVELTGLLPGPVDLRRLHVIDRRLRAFLRDAGEELAERGRAGLVREGHGDLRAEHVLVEGDSVRIVDRIEFRADLREVDVADDLAFLVMDLVALGHPGAARELVAAYRDQHGDPGPDALLAFYAARRALIRAKVALLREGTVGERDASRDEARHLLDVAERFAWRTHGPLALVVSGPSGVGKSVLAAALAERSGFAVRASDVVRKRAAGLAPEERGGAELYAPGSGPRTYAELGRQAAAALARDGGVVIDATCLRRADRDALLRELGGWRRAVVHVACSAPAVVLEERLRRRALEPMRISDATLAVGRRQAATAEPLDEVPADRLLLLRTDRPVAALVEAVAAALDA